MLGSARILGVQRGNVADGVFLYFELFDFQIQRRPRNSEFGSGTIWSSNFSVAFRSTGLHQWQCLLNSKQGPFDVHAKRQIDSTLTSLYRGGPRHAPTKAEVLRRNFKQQGHEIIWRNAHVSHNASTQLFQQRQTIFFCLSRLKRQLQENKLLGIGVAKESWGVKKASFRKVAYDLEKIFGRDVLQRFHERETDGLGEFFESRFVKHVRFDTLSCLIFKSSVDRGIPSLAAAPFGPATFPLLSTRAASMSSLS